MFAWMQFAILLVTAKYLSAMCDKVWTKANDYAGHLGSRGRKAGLEN